MWRAREGGGGGKGGGLNGIASPSGPTWALLGTKRTSCCQVQSVSLETFGWVEH